MNTIKKIVAGCLLLGNITAQDQQGSEETNTPSAKQLEDYETDIVNIPGLHETYGIDFDRNHMMGPITTEFVMEQIILN